MEKNKLMGAYKVWTVDNMKDYYNDLINEEERITTVRVDRTYDAWN